MSKKRRALSKCRMFITIMCLGLTGCADVTGLQFNLPVAFESTAPKTKGEFWLFKDDIPTPNNRKGSDDWYQFPICRGCSILFGGWCIEEGSNNPTPAKVTWEIRKGDKDIISITSPDGGHKIIITGLRPGSVRDLLVRDEHGHQYHLFDITVK